MTEDYYEGEISHIMLLKKKMLEGIKKSLVQNGFNQSVRDQIDLYEKTFNWNLSLADIFPPHEEIKDVTF